MVVGLAFAVGAIAVSAGTAGAQSDSGSGGTPAPKSSAPFDDGATRGSGSSSPQGGCGGGDTHVPDDGAATAAQLT
jgi:hypothetical protein